LTNWQRYDIILLSTTLTKGSKEQEMIGRGLRMKERIRMLRFPEIRRGEQRNPTHIRDLAARDLTTPDLGRIGLWG
jgi:hypothetical protein